MPNRMIAGSVLLCATVCYVAWGQDLTPKPKNAEPPAKAGAKGEASEKASQDKSPAGPETPKDRPAVKPGSAPHLTQSQDLANERAIRAQSAALFAEYNAKNANAFAERFLPNAEYELDDGEVIIGRDAIRDYFAASFKKFPKAQAHMKESKLRLISLHMAIEEGKNSIVHSIGDATLCDHVAIWTFSEGHWLVASIRDLPGDEVVEAAHERLQPLAWLVGEWLDESPEALIKTSCRWSDDRNFLLQEFTVKVQGSEVLSGTQRIGWDPLSRKVRGWVFDSHGGYGESFWNWDGERWVIRSSAVRFDGTIVASLNYLIPRDSNAYRWESSHRMSGDEPLPDVSLLIVRQAPPPEPQVTDESRK